VPGQRGCKLDWNATFRNRIRDMYARPKPAGTDETIKPQPRNLMIPNEAKGTRDD